MNFTCAADHFIPTPQRNSNSSGAIYDGCQLVSVSEDCSYTTLLVTVSLTECCSLIIAGTSKLKC